MPQASLVRLKGCGHLAFVTQPERVAAEVGRFLHAEQCGLMNDEWQTELQ